MSSILEKAFVALLNEEHEKAEELFHKFIVERARQIHESNRAGDDYVLDENWNEEITSESYFTEDDLSDLEDGHDDEVDGDVEGDEAGEDFGGDDFGGDVEGDEADFGDEHQDDQGDEFGAEGDDLESDEDRIDHLEDQIEKLTAEFEAMMDAIGDEGEVADDLEDDGEDFGADNFGDEEGEAEDEADHVEDDMDGADEDHAEDTMEEGEDYDDITESIIDELEKVSVSLEDGHEVGTGKSFTQNRGANIPQKSKDARQGGAPIKMKQDAHKGYERETAPSVEVRKPVRNNMKTGVAGLPKVSKEGNKSAEINKLSSENGNTKSPLEGK